MITKVELSESPAATSPTMTAAQLWALATKAVAMGGLGYNHPSHVRNTLGLKDGQTLADYPGGVDAAWKFLVAHQAAKQTPENAPFDNLNSPAVKAMREFIHDHKVDLKVVAGIIVGVTQDEGRSKSSDLLNEAEAEAVLGALKASVTVSEAVQSALAAES